MLGFQSGNGFRKRNPDRIRDDMDYAERVFRYSWHSGNDEPHILEYRILNRINLFHLQNELAKLKSAVWSDFSAKEDDLARLRTTLHDYAAFPFIADLPGDPYNSRYCTFRAPSHPEAPVDPLRRFLKARLPRQWTYTKDEMRVHIDEYLKNDPPETVSPLVDKLARFIISFTGGVSLIVPMLIMSLPGQDTTKSLAVTSVAVTIFSVVMGLIFKVSNEETVVATATYAAVLVVFVGTSS
ncbi:hypothetical protein N0V92_012733 [Colletotrichum tropicale]|nr:hypothetical protein N0V92_012733 [Colletotrichum tropicale]